MPPTIPRTAGAEGGSPTGERTVPRGVEVAADWSWRALVVVGATAVLLWLVAYFSVIVLPLVVAVLLAALAQPAYAVLRRVLPRSIASLLVVALGLVLVVALLGYAGQQVASGATDLVASSAQGLEQVRTWLVEGPLGASESQVDEAVASVRDAVASLAGGGALQDLLAVGVTAGNVVVGFFLAIFALFFFLSDGERIWTWLVHLLPRRARDHADDAGRTAWTVLGHYVRATVLIAVVDAVGIMIWAAVLGVPFVLAIGVLVFLGAFIPVVGATIAGAVAVLVALVDGGPVTALLMLLGVLVVQQIEGNLLQPFLMGRLVSLHPLAVIVAVAAGSVVAGIAGALVAVPLAATVNAAVSRLAGRLGDPVDPPGPGPGPDTGDPDTDDPYLRHSDSPTDSRTASPSGSETDDPTDSHTRIPDE